MKANEADLIPDWWELEVSSVENILFLGSGTIRSMIISWRQSAWHLVPQIKRASDMLEIGNSVSIVEIAKNYENPTFTEIGFPRDDPDGKVIPLDAASIMRKEGATNFNVCGWCDFSEGGYTCYNINALSSCEFDISTGKEKAERRFDCPCFLKEAPTEVFDQIRAELKKSLGELVEQKKDIDNKIKSLLSIERAAEKKPVVPPYRPHNWFKIGDEVVCRLGGPEKLIIPEQFIVGKMMGEYECYISVCHYERVYAGPNLEGYGLDYNRYSPDIMNIWEYEYLLAHPEFAKIWAKTCEIKDFDSDEFLKALISEPIEIHKK